MTKKLQSITNKTAPVAALAAVILIWFICCNFEIVPAYMLPSPADVAKAFSVNFAIMMKQAVYTLQEAVYGLGIGIILAFFAAAFTMYSASFVPSAPVIKSFCISTTIK